MWLLLASAVVQLGLLIIGIWKFIRGIRLMWRWCNDITDDNTLLQAALKEIAEGLIPVFLLGVLQHYSFEYIERMKP